MKKLTSIALFLAASTSLTALAPALAHEGHGHKVMGIVVSITAEKIEVTNPEGKKETLVLTKATVFKKDKEMVAAKEVLVGARVVLTVIEKDGKKLVSEVRIGVTPEAQAPAVKH